MRRLILLALALFPLASLAQNGSVQGYCEQGATSAQTQGLASTNRLQGIIPSCTITVFYTGTSTQVPGSLIFSDIGGDVLGNPFTASTAGRWTFWASLLQGYDIVLSGGISPNVYTSPFTLLNKVPSYAGCGSQNGQVEASCFPGTDFGVQLGEAAAALPASGGQVTAYGFGANTSTAIQILAQSNPSKPITVKLNPATIYTLNTVFSSGLIAASVASQVSGTTGACIWPIANGSAITVDGRNQLGGDVILGPAAATYDEACNANQDGTQESLLINGVGFEGNATATMKGSLLHLVQLFSETKVENVTTYYPFGNAVTVSGGGPYVFFNDNIDDGYPYAGGTPGITYPGSPLTINCVVYATFTAGSVQDNSLHNPLIVMQNCLTSDGRTPTTGFGLQNQSIHFQNEYFEIETATVGSFSGHATNVDPIQMVDPNDVSMGGLTIDGTAGGGDQAHLFDIQYSGNAGAWRGPVDLDAMTLQSTWAGLCVVNNNFPSAYVSPQQACVIPTSLSFGAYGIGKYRWGGNGEYVDYEDAKNFSSMQSLNTNGVINAALESGADIGAKVGNALTLCANQCTVRIPAGNYSFSTTIALPMGVIGNYKLQCDPGAVMTYTGTGDAILAFPTGPPSFANLTVSGCRLLGSGSGNGIHVVASSFINLDHNTITGFNNGVLLDGPNTVNVDHNFIESNTNGIKMIPTFCTGAVCGPTPASGSAFTTNKINIVQNSIVQNSQWGILDSNAQSGNTGSLDNLIEGNDLETNGGAGSQYGAIYIYRGSGYKISSNYFENSPRQIVLGTLPLGSPYYFATQQTTIDSNHFTELIGTPYSIELINATYTRIENNDTIDATMNSGNCFVNVGTGATAENHTLFGQNDVLLSGGGNLICQSGAVIQNFVGSGSYSTFNQNFTPRLVYGAFPLTAGTSDSVPAQFVTSTSACFAVASSNGSQATAQGLVASIYMQPGTGSATIFHPSGHAGLLFDIYCTGPLNL